LSDYLFTLGIDWGYHDHACCLFDVASKRRFRRKFLPSAEGLADMRAWLRKLVPDLSTLAAGIERPDHPVVEGLIEAGIDCFAINPKQIERFRAFLSAGGAKDDPRDAEVIAVALANSPQAFRKLETPDELSIALREASRRLDTLNKQLLANTSRLWDQLQRFAPQLVALSSGADDPCFWELLELGADHRRAAKLRPAAVAKVLKAHGKRKLTADTAIALLRSPRLPLAPGALDAILATIASLLPQLRLTCKLRDVAQADIKRLVATAGIDAEIIDSLIGVDALTVAVFLGEAHQAIKERDLPALRLLTGVAPVTDRSGDKHHVFMRRACNEHLRNACFHMARTACVHDPYAEALYARQRVQGASAARAYRTVADRLLARLVACLRTGTRYATPGPRTQVSAAAAP